MSNLSNPKVIAIIEQVKQALERITSQNNYHTDLGNQVSFMRQWFDVRDSILPCLSYFILDESPVENKGCSYKQELSLKVEGYAERKQAESIFFLISDIKRAILSSDMPFLTYLGYEINLPEEGSNLVAVTINFKINYVENLG